MPSLHLRIEGRVQGVGFRWFVVHEARALGLRGLVRNLSDGAVELEAEGPAVSLRQLLETVRTGPPGARVLRVIDAWGDHDGHFRGFQIVD